jgi:predicted thioesterase
MPREKLLSINALKLLFTAAMVGFVIRTATALIQHRLETEDSDNDTVAG